MKKLSLGNRVMIDMRKKEKILKFNIPTNKEDKRRLLIDIEKQVGVPLREENGFFIVSKYKD